eukprot:g11142.t1
MTTTKARSHRARSCSSARRLVLASQALRRVQAVVAPSTIGAERGRRNGFLEIIPGGGVTSSASMGPNDADVWNWKDSLEGDIEKLAEEQPGTEHLGKHFNQSGWLYSRKSKLRKEVLDAFSAVCPTDPDSLAVKNKQHKVNYIVTVEMEDGDERVQYTGPVVSVGVSATGPEVGEEEELRIPRLVTGGWNQLLHILWFRKNVNGDEYDEFERRSPHPGWSWSKYYRGGLKGGEPDGEGFLQVYQTEDGDWSYTGKWKDGKPQGEGKMLLYSRRRKFSFWGDESGKYGGNWDKGKPNGKGKGWFLIKNRKIMRVDFDDKQNWKDGALMPGTVRITLLDKEEKPTYDATIEKDGTPKFTGSAPDGVTLQAADFRFPGSVETAVEVPAAMVAAPGGLPGSSALEIAAGPATETGAAGAASSLAQRWSIATPGLVFNDLKVKARKFVAGWTGRA